MIDFEKSRIWSLTIAMPLGPKDARGFENMTLVSYRFRASVNDASAMAKAILSRLKGSVYEGMPCYVSTLNDSSEPITDPQQVQPWEAPTCQDESGYMVPLEGWQNNSEMN